MIKQKFMYVAAFLFLGANAVHAQFSLEIDGQTVVPAGEITDIRYNPDLRAFVLNSVHLDWRCVADAGTTPVVSPGDFRLVLDSANSATETDAVYRIAGELNGGSITQDILGGRIIVQTSSNPAEQLTCAPFSESFSSSSFENPLATRSNAPESPFTAGGTLVVPVTVTNHSKSLVVTDVAVDLTWATEPVSAAGVSPPTFSETVTQTAPGTARWTVDSLFPGESRTIDVAYVVDSQTASGTVIRTQSSVVGAMNRTGISAIAVGTPSTDVAEVTIGVASGDLAAGLQSNNPVAGDGSENVVLSYAITNNAGISMTSVLATVAAVNLPSGLTTGSVTPSAGSFSGNQWSVPLIPPGQTVTLEQAFTAAAATAASEQVCGSFSIDSAAEQLVDTGDDAASGCAVVTREIDLHGVAPVVKPFFGASTVDAGGVFGVQFQISNFGPSNASQVGATLALSVDPADAGVVINQGTSSSVFGNLVGGGSSIDFQASSEIEPNGVTRTANIDVDIPLTVADQTNVCLEVVSLSGDELDAAPGNNLPPQTCITVVNTGT